MDEWRRSAPVYVDTFDGFRAYAILTIVVLHVAFFAQYVPSAEVPKALLVSTFLALDVLFFVSGFVLFLPVMLQGGMGDLRSYAIRRVARLAPAFYVSLVVLAIAAPLLRPDLHPPFPPVDAGTVLSHVFFLHMEASVAYGSFVPGFGLNGPVWTLAIDMIFYALLPLVAGFWLRRPFLGFGIAAALAAGWTLALDPGDQYFKHALDPTNRYLIWHQAPLFLADCGAGRPAPLWGLGGAASTGACWFCCRWASRACNLGLSRRPCGWPAGSCGANCPSPYRGGASPSGCCCGTSRPGWPSGAPRGSWPRP